MSTRKPGEVGDESKAVRPSLVAQGRAENLLHEFADNLPQDLVMRLACHLELFATEWMDAAKVLASPPWLSDAAEALGLVRPSDGAPLALNWNQILEEIRKQRRSLAEAKHDLQRLMGDERIEPTIKEKEAVRVETLNLLKMLDDMRDDRDRCRQRAEQAERILNLYLDKEGKVDTGAVCTHGADRAQLGCPEDQE